LTSVSKLAGSSPASPAERPGNAPLPSPRRIPGRPRCAVCRKRVEHTPGKRPKVYCSNACKQRAKRVAAAASDTITTPLSAGQRPFSGAEAPLGKGLTEFSHEAGEPTGTQPSTLLDPTREARAKAASVRRWKGRKILNRISAIGACAGCGRRVLDPDTGVIHARAEEGYAVTVGLVRCGRIWFCPQCSAAIRRGRTEEVKTGALRWLAQGGTLAVVVLTARHNRTSELEALAAALWGEPKRDASGALVLDASGKPRRTPGAYQRMLTAPAFYGRAARRGKRPVGGIRHRIGYVGMVRASEVTRSQANGWHPHMNLLVFLGGRLNTGGTPAKGEVVKHFTPGRKALEEWEDWLRELWASALRKADPAFEPSTECHERGCKCRGRGHGVMVQLVKSADDAALIEYLTKVQDGKAPADSVRADLDAAGGAALETVRADQKTGRGRKSMTPFQMLYRLWDLEVAGMDPTQAEGYGTAAQLRGWWLEYEVAMSGRRAIEWTRGLRGHVDLAGDDSEERDLEYVYEAEAAKLTGGIAMTAEAHATVVGADAEMDVEALVLGEYYDSAGDLVAALGGRADHVRVIPAEELEALQEALFARVVARREERERQARAAQFEADQAAAQRERGRLAVLLGQLLAARRMAPEAAAS